MRITFKAAKTFFSPETNSEYVAGLSYSASAADKVFPLIKEWIEQGKIALGGSVAQVAAQGEVTNASNPSGGDPQRDR